MNKIIFLTILYLSFFSCKKSYAREVFVEAFSFRSSADSKPLGLHFWKNGSFVDNEGDVAIEYRVCGKNIDYLCIFTANRNVVFAIPRAVALNRHEEWGFGGMKFKIVGISEVRGDTLVNITSKATAGFEGFLRDNGYKLNKIDYLYSVKRGVLSFNRYFEFGKPDPLVDSWVFPDGLNLDVHGKKLHRSALLTAKQFQRLRDGAYELPPGSQKTDIK